MTVRRCREIVKVGIQNAERKAEDKTRLDLITYLRPATEFWFIFNIK